MKIPTYKKIGIPRAGSIQNTLKILRRYNLHTVCEEARCPNKGVCFSRSSVTFLILGSVCTRGCGFCGVSKGVPEIVEHDEPQRIARAIEEMKLEYVVITSPTRDDLSDGGAGVFVKTVEEIKKARRKIKIELLIPDFSGDRDLLREIVSCEPDTIAHNMETVERLYPVVRPLADYKQSLEILEFISEFDNVTCKSGFMVGLGETTEEIYKLVDDIITTGCSDIVVGQYLRSDVENLPVERYYKDEFFSKIRDELEDVGFERVLSEPLARTSYTGVVLSKIGS